MGKIILLLHWTATDENFDLTGISKSAVYEVQR